MHTAEFHVHDGVLIRYSGPGGKVRLPEDITHIGDNAFENCCTVTDIDLGQNLTHIGTAACPKNAGSES